MYQLKITLRGSQPPIWRRLLVSENIRLDALHRVIQAVMGWEDCHLHFFLAGGKYYQGNRTVSLAQLLTFERDRIHYTYDMDDRWDHVILLEKIVPGQSQLPVCQGGARACPPEECGGMVGYEELLDSLSGSNQNSAWLGEIRPDFFELDEARRRLAALARKAQAAG